MINSFKRARLSTYQGRYSLMEIVGLWFFCGFSNKILDKTKKYQIKFICFFIYCHIEVIEENRSNLLNLSYLMHCIV